MTANTVLARGRAAAEALMQDGCTVRRVTGEVTDQFSGAITKTYTTLYVGRCRIQQRREASASSADVGEAYRLLLRIEVQLPMSVTGLQPEDEITVDAAAHDPDLLYRTFVVRDLMHKSHATARRVGCQERTS